ncbi:hypothetical protein XNA1_2400015 [Xenorhabdus nematophila str. Anatoliense]|nr:hypothetical protein XNA1_2400015 [Xenorhabdus nematophila str. Anatoliense]
MNDIKIQINIKFKEAQNALSKYIFQKNFISQYKSNRNNLYW